MNVLSTLDDLILCYKLLAIKFKPIQMKFNAPIKFIGDKNEWTKWMFHLNIVDFVHQRR